MTTKKPSIMTARQINDELDRLEKLSSQLNDKLIRENRRWERPSQTRHKTDELSQACCKVWDRLDALRLEMELRYSPSYRLPLVRGKYGPREKE